MILIQSPLLVLINFSQNLLKWTFSRTRFLLISMGSVILNVLLLLVAIIVFNIDVLGVFKVNLVVQSCFGILGMYFIRHWLAIPNNFKFLRQLLPYAIPLGVICCMGAFVPAMERSLVNNLLGSQELGLYAAGTKVAMLILFFIQAFQTAWGPFSLAIHKESDAAVTYSCVLKVYVIVICIFVLFLASIAHPVINILASNRYIGATVVVFPLAMGLAIQGMSWITEIGIGLSKKSYLSLYSYIVYVLMTGFSIYFMARVFGLIGVAFGVMFGHIAKAFVATLLAQRVFPLEWPIKPVVILLSSTTLLGGIGSWVLSYYSVTIGLFILCSSVLLILTIAWATTLSRPERDFIRTNFWYKNLIFKVKA